MNQNYQLCSPLCVWLGYFVPEDQSTKSSQNNTLKAHVIKSYNDLVRIDIQAFQEHDEKRNTAASQINLSLNRWQIQNQRSQLNYFREGIKHLGEREKCERRKTCFQIDKEIDKFQEIYEQLMFNFLGESECYAQDTKVTHFNSYKLNAPIRFHYRVEVWTKFNNSELETVSLFQRLLKQTFVMIYE